jgi:arylsulfatase A-like enzyme
MHDACNISCNLAALVEYLSLIFIVSGLPDGIETLPQALRKVGYRTAMAGKWHLGHAQWKQTPVGKGFQQFAGCFMWVRRRKNEMTDLLSH